MTQAIQFNSTESPLTVRRSSDKLAAAFATLKAMQPRWSITVGQPESAGWLSGVSLQDANDGELNRLLKKIGTHMGTERRAVIAPSFALRFSWASGIVFGPFVVNETIADVRLSNLSLKFSDNTLFEQAALHQLQVFDDYEHGLSPIQQLQAVLIAQAKPVVDALHQWSRFSRQAI